MMRTRIMDPLLAKGKQMKQHVLKHPAEYAEKRASDGSWDLDLEEVGE